jgi:hypothetical protein
MVTQSLEPDFTPFVKGGDFELTQLIPAVGNEKTHPSQKA